MINCLTPQDPDQFRDAIELIKSRGFIPQQHSVITPDGYILTIHRIINPHVFYTIKPLLLIHGILASSTDWLLNSGGFLDDNGNFIEDRFADKIAFRKLNGKKTAVGGSLGFVLSQFGYDVWMGNCRGTVYSKNHTFLNHKKDSKYWEFSLDEIAKYDLPSMIHYILRKTHSASLGYIAHSQGTFVMFALLSSKPKYENIINPFIALAPVTFVSTAWGTLIRRLSPLYPIFRRFPAELLPPNEIQLTLQGKLCRSRSLRRVCGFLLGIFTGHNPEQLDLERIGAFAAHFPTGVSTWILAQYGQLAGRDTFEMFDHGLEENYRRYGQADPPDYPLHKIRSTKILLFHSINDPLADIADVNRLKKCLRVPFEDYLIPQQKWSHFDYFLAKDVGYYVNAKIIDFLRMTNVNY